MYSLGRQPLWFVVTTHRRAALRHRRDKDDVSVGVTEPSVVWLGSDSPDILLSIGERGATTE
jgi:hypothetical protein